MFDRWRDAQCKCSPAQRMCQRDRNFLKASFKYFEVNGLSPVILRGSDKTGTGTLAGQFFYIDFASLRKRVPVLSGILKQFLLLVSRAITFSFEPVFAQQLQETSRQTAFCVPPVRRRHCVRSLHAGENLHVDRRPRSPAALPLCLPDHEH